MADNVRPWHLLQKNEPQGRRVSEEIQKERYSICESCPSLAFGFCKECGCKMSWKTSLANASCPLKKWAADTGENVSDDAAFGKVYNKKVSE